MPPDMPMQIEAIVQQCMKETGFRGDDARDVCLVALLVSSDRQEPGRQLRARIRETYLQAAPERGSFFLLFVLPVLVSIIGHWVAKWIMDRTDMRTIRSQAFDAVTESLPGMTGVRMSTHSTTATGTGSETLSKDT